MNRETPAVTVDHATKTIRPSTKDGDDYYGLSVGSNGTATITRRACVTPSGTGPKGVAAYRWVRFDGRPAVGLTLIPSADSELTPNPWGGK